MQNVLPYLFETYQHPKTRHPTSYSGLPFVTYYAIKSYLPFFKAKLLFLSYSTKHPHICTLKRSPRCLTVTFDCGCLSSGFFLLLPRIGRIHVLCLLRAKQKPQKPLGEDGGRCPRLLKVVPSRHRSACGYWRYGYPSSQDRCYI